MTPKQFANYVNQAVGSEFGPQINTLTGQIGGMNRLFQTEMGQTNVGSQEFGRMLAQIAPAVMKTYQNAANYDAAYAKGFQDTLASAAPNLNPAVGQVLSTEYGLLPSQTFAEQGANMTAAAQMLPATAENLRNQALNVIGANQAKFQAGAATSLARLLGEQGKAGITLQNQLQTQARQAYATNVSAARAAAYIQNMQFQQGMTAAKYNTAVKEWAATYNMKVADYYRLANEANARLKQSASRLGLEWAKFRASEKAARVATVKQRTTWRTEAEKQLQTYFYGSQGKQVYQLDKNGNVKYDKNGKPMRTYVDQKAPFQYKDAINALIREFPGLGPRTIIQMVNSYYKPGVQGRPQTQDPIMQDYLNNLIGEGFGLPGMPYANPAQSVNAMGFLRNGAPLTIGRADQGRDIQTRPGEPIIAPGEGYVVAIGHDPGGGGKHFGPHYPIVYFTNGPFAGHTMYIGHTRTALKVGERFMTGSPLSYTQRSGPSNGGAPSGWAEIGYAPGGTPGPMGQPVPFGRGTLRPPGKAYSVGNAKAYANSQLAQYGWNNSTQRRALNRLWNMESGWKYAGPGSVNPTSGALGIPQLNPQSHAIPPGYRQSYQVQIDWGLNYILHTYGSPARALDFHLRNGWY